MTIVVREVTAPSGKFIHSLLQRVLSNQTLEAELAQYTKILAEAFGYRPYSHLANGLRRMAHAQWYQNSLAPRLAETRVCRSPRSLPKSKPHLPTERERCMSPNCPT